MLHRAARILLDVLTLASPLGCVAAGVWWVRSYGHLDLMTVRLPTLPGLHARWTSAGERAPLLTNEPVCRQTAPPADKRRRLLTNEPPC